MAVTITTIQPQDSIASSRLTLNSNFSALKAGIDNVQVLLDPTTSILTGVKSATINDSTLPLSNVIFQVGKSSVLAGSVTMGTIGASSSVLINGVNGVTISQSSLTLTTGNIILSGVSSLVDLKGHISVSNEQRLPGLATAFSGLIGLTNTSTTTINVANLKYLVISNASLSTTGLTASLLNGNLGQVLEIYHHIGASGGPVNFDVTNFQGLTGSLIMKASGDTLKCVYDGTKWYLMSYSAASFATGGTTSSVRFTTV
jgi:hypothetical protein